MKIPELLCPAGDKQKAFTAFRYGAGAVYCGVPLFSLRTRENYITEDDIAEIVNFAHKNNKKVYVTLNNFPHEKLISEVKKYLKFIAKVKPDGIILADFGVLNLANELAPNVPKHISVQTSTVNSPGIQLWQKLGVERIILAREVTLSEVSEIKKVCPEMELEYFVHGAMCMSYSGRCLLSNHFTGRDANLGACAQPCRWNYKVFEQNKIHDVEKSALLEEEKRRGEHLQAEEDFHGTHLMSSRDMCMLDRLEDLIKAGVDSLKVEGRNKTPYYVAIISRAYRQALNDLANDKPFNPELLDEIRTTANRGFCHGFLDGRPGEKGIQKEENRSTSNKEFCGIVRGWQDGQLEILPKNKIIEGGEIEFVMPQIADDFSIIAKNLKFNDLRVDSFHGGNLNGVATLTCLKEVPEGIFIRQKTANISHQKL
jgi:putative protease